MPSQTVLCGPCLCQLPHIFLMFPHPRNLFPGTHLQRGNPFSFKLASLQGRIQLFLTIKLNKQKVPPRRTRGSSSVCRLSEVHPILKTTSSPPSAHCYGYQRPVLERTGCTKAESNEGILSVLLNIQNTVLAFGKQRKGNKRSGCFLFPSESRTLNKSFTLSGLLAPKERMKFMRPTGWN